MSVDYAVVTGRQQQVWSLGDYGRVGSLLSCMGESLVRRLDGHIDELGGCDQTVLEAGEAVTVVTPTGGGFGKG